MKKQKKKRKKWIIIVLGIILVIVIIAIFVVQRLLASISGGGSADFAPDASDAAKKFVVEQYTDTQTGLSVSYNIYIPEGYDSAQEYPLLVFIADSSSVGTNVSAPLTRNVGGAIWATDSEQAKHPSFVVVPCYLEIILDDHGTYTMTDYVELTARMIEAIEEKYSIDTSRVYGTGQSMGAMTTMYLAANHPDLYTAVLIVDGQWRIEELEGLKDTTFTYFAAGGDDKASAGQQEVKDMLDSAGIPYGELTGLDAQASVTELDQAAGEMYAAGCPQNFVTWETGTVGSSFGSEHMASFKYGYKIEAVRDWLYSQTKTN